MYAGAHAHLSDEKFGEPLRQSAFLAGEDHLEHVPMELLHDNKHLLRGLEHTLQIYDTQVAQTLKREIPMMFFSYLEGTRQG